MNSNDIQNKIKEINIELLSRKRHKDSLLKSREEIERNIRESMSKLELLKSTSEFSQKLKNILDTNVRGHFESLVTSALRYVYEDDSYSFEIDVGSFRNRPTYSFNVKSKFGDTEISGDPKFTRGGGVKEVISLILRFVFIEIFKNNKQPLFFDEKLRMIFGSNISRVIDFIVKYSKEKGRQIIFITHDSQLSDSGKTVYFISKTSSGSKIEKLR